PAAGRPGRGGARRPAAGPGVPRGFRRGRPRVPPELADPARAVAGAPTAGVARPVPGHRPADVAPARPSESITASPAESQHADVPPPAPGKAERGTAPLPRAYNTFRAGSVRRPLASSSPTNSSFDGSRRSLRLSSHDSAAAWQAMCEWRITWEFAAG